MTKIKNKTILVTGGAMGIGKRMAERCLAEGARRAILWDINETALNTTVDELRSKGYVVDSYVVDISDVEDIEWAAQDVLSCIGPVDILFNNAGIVVGKYFHEHSRKDIDKTNDINVAGVMHTTRVFIKNMLAQRQGHIVNIASAAGLIPNPKMSVYASSKWAVLGWSESLRLEMEELKKGVRVTTVTPSYINTGMFNGVKAPLLTPILDPAFIVDRIIEGVKNNEILIQEPFMVKSIPVLKGLLPTRVFDVVAGKLFGVYKSMDQFKGRKQKPPMPAPKVAYRSTKSKSPRKAEG